MSTVAPHLPVADAPALLTHPADLGPWLDRFAAAFAALSRLTLAAPSEGVLESVRDESVLPAWPFDDADSARGVSLLAESRIAREHADAVRSDYNRLFFGPDRMIAPPYESVHRSDERLVFERETLQVRAAYAEFGLAAPRLNREPDDHLGLELDFLATLCVRAMDALDAGDEATLGHVLDGVARFLAEHLLVWGPTVLSQAAAGARTYFYQGVAAMGLGCLAQAEQAFRRP